MSNGSRLAVLFAGLLVGMVLGCGSPKPAAYVGEANLARRAQSAGDHQRAGRHYERAATLAVQQRDADELRYLAADSYVRAGSLAAAATLHGQLARGAASGERRARSDFALARLKLREGDEADGHVQLAGAIRRHPESGLASRAVSEHLDYLRAAGGAARALSFLDAERQWLSGTSLAETLDYLRARELEQAGRMLEARDAYLACAARFPYPAGAYWDDALFHAAEAELRLGAPRRALAHLERLLREQETASIVGSYQRARYAEGQLKLAEIYRDQLHDKPRARRELRKVWDRHPKSRLVDDALFEEALLARSEGDQAGACAPLRIILKERKDSRYAPCAHALCAEIAELEGRACHDYVKRRAGID